MSIQKDCSTTSDKNYQNIKFLDNINSFKRNFNKESYENVNKDVLGRCLNISKGNADVVGISSVPDVDLVALESIIQNKNVPLSKTYEQESYNEALEQIYNNSFLLKDLPQCDSKFEPISTVGYPKELTNPQCWTPLCFSHINPKNDANPQSLNKIYDPLTANRTGSSRDIALLNYCKNKF